MAWYIQEFDPNWIKCRNYRCGAEFLYKNANKKRKCPICGVNGKGNIRLKKLPTIKNKTDKNHCVSERIGEE